MRTPPPAAPDPWASADVDDAWRDIVSSAPPPRDAGERPLPLDAPDRVPPPDAFALARSPSRDAFARAPAPLPPSPMGAALADLHSWQEHGAPRSAITAELPAFSASDRKLWVAAGALMGLATLVLALLGLLTLGGPRPVAVEHEPAAAVAARPAAAAPHAASAPAVAPVAVAAAAAPSQSPRLLKRTRHLRRHHAKSPLASR